MQAEGGNVSPEQTNARIAELCPDVARIDGGGIPVWLNEPRKKFEPCADLNAMHEAEKALINPAIRGREYAQYLFHVCKYSMGGDITYGEVFATASQRAEALLKMLNKLTYQ